MVTRRFTVVLEPAEEGGFIVKCVELLVASQGETREEAIKKLKRLLKGIWRLKPSFYAVRLREKGLKWLSRLPLLSWRKVVKVLVKAGFEPVRQKGSYPNPSQK